MRSPGPLSPDHPDAPTSRTTATAASPPAPAASWLWPLVEATDAALAVGEGGANALLRVVVPDDATDELELGFRPLADDDHPLDLLLGFVAPDDWVALGVTCQGRARPLDVGSAAPPGSGPGRARVRITLLLDRSGDSVALLRRDGRIARLAEPPDGTVADACRRALRLPTAPAPGGTAELWTLWWLDRLVMTAVEPGSAGLLTGWAQVAAQHPAAWLPVSDRRYGRSGHSAPDAAAPDGPAPHPPGRRPRSDGLPRRESAGGPAVADLGLSLGRLGVGPEPDVLAAAALALADAWPWQRLRTDPQAPEIPGATPGPDVAAWMDGGMFARWLLSSFPSRRDLLDAATAVLPDGLAYRVEAAVEATLAAQPLSSSAS